eukprot:538847-Pelagomonas_calceolata.AAC.1
MVWAGKGRGREQTGQNQRASCLGRRVRRCKRGTEAECCSCACIWNACTQAGWAASKGAGAPRFNKNEAPSIPYVGNGGRARLTECTATQEPSRSRV